MPTAQAPILRSELVRQFREVRAETEARCRPLSAEDCNLQSMPDASPAKWHLAHTTWFFETFLLGNSPGYQPFDPAFQFLFNSYYEALGPRHPRPRRGMLSRPGIDEVYAYRRAIDERVVELLRNASDGQCADLAPVLTLGLHHEQQHQELILTDILHAFSQNPLKPAYRQFGPTGIPASAARRIDFPSGVQWIGHGGTGFAFDNEGPRHRVWVEAFGIADRLTTNAEYLEFMSDGGYERPEFWLSDGWAARKANDWTAPSYWEQGDNGWRQFSLAGMIDVKPNQPVCHLSYYEADAFARWAGARLPTEAEWELAAGELRQGDDCVWQWTASPYTAYPGYRPAAGAIGEYNAKFMCNQMVLRGGSAATPRTHVRRTYRNFFPPDTRWQFAGLRLASDS